MFHSFIVKEEDRDFLRFLWFKENDTSKEIIEYRMRVHVFGNSPSPAVAIYGLRRAAAYDEKEYGSDAKHFVEREFYVDDGLLSTPTAAEAIDLLTRTKEMLATSNLRLHKFASNSKEVMDAFPIEDHAKGLKDLNLEVDPTPIQCSLGLSWDVKRDVFTFHVTDIKKPFTRRGILATVNSLFDPLGFVAPIIIEGKFLLRELSGEALDWDSPLPEDREEAWNAWRKSLQDLKRLEIPRPYIHTTLSTALRKELHIFSDASVRAIAAVAYLRVINEEGACHTGFVLGKAKLAPQAAHTIPRLELGAAVLAAELAETIINELDFSLDAVEFYTDNRVVLGYIYNQTRRFYVYVANRVQRIRKVSSPTQWHYVSTKHNPADHATCSVSAALLSTTTWLTGPTFLLQVHQNLPLEEEFDLIGPELDVEIRPLVTTLSTDDSHLECQRFERFSSWRSLVRAIASLIHVAQTYKSSDDTERTCRSWHYCAKPCTVEELLQAEEVIIKSVQRRAYQEELTCIAKGNDIPRPRLTFLVDASHAPNSKGSFSPLTSRRLQGNRSPQTAMETVVGLGHVTLGSEVGQEMTALFQILSMRLALCFLCVLCLGKALPNKGSLQFEDKWDLMRPIVLKLLRQESVTKQQWFDLFSDVHAVCLWDDKGPAKIHQALKEDILDFIKQAQARVLSHQDDTALLKAYIVEWRKFFTQCDILPKPFCQLEITLMGKQGSNKKSNVEDSIVRKLMLDTWNESIFSNIKNRLQDSAMKLVHAERLGEAFDSQLVIGVRESYVNLCSNPDDKLQIYRDNFEKAYLDSTERFYRTQAPSYLQQNGVQNYMKYADAKLREEEKRALRYLETRRECNSVQALMECCVNALVTSFKETILAECPGMIKRNETDKLHLMFSLMDKVPSGIEPMLKDLEEHIISAGLADMVAAAETITTDSEKYVEQLLTLFNRFSKLVKEAFQDDPRFLTARDKAYKAVVNDATIFKLELPMKQKGVGLKTQPESKCPELLANYCDMLLRKTPLSKKLTSEEIELKLKEVLLVLKYVQNKDVFMRYHKAHLTRRLILDISADSEIEENMVEWLREVGMPADYVNKLARMFQDIKVSEDLNQVFKEMHKHNKLALPADSVNIKILNAGAWSRSSEKVFVSLPTELEDLIPEVEDFYKKNHSGRKLHWHHLMSNGIITFKNEVGQYDLEVTTFQLAVLFAWNQRPREKISFENLKLATELPDAELRRTLWSLVAFPKLKRQVLSYEPQVSSPKDFTDSTLFFVNQEFSLIKNSKVQKRGKINLIGRLQLTTERMREEENEGIVQLRILRTQEAIIQIMKMRKKITNAQLQTELVEILKNMFLPQKKMIKEQIEWLIEHKYIKRDESDINTFIYMA
ncbi:hypothetical protein QTP86_014522 [Hemibagrus guttatus]|nr:hypothetical protein QTP86_014522 [Hemibagrus guttatus]